jgi:hypothetical protein
MPSRPLRGCGFRDSCWPGTPSVPGPCPGRCCGRFPVLRWTG